MPRSREGVLSAVMSTKTSSTAGVLRVRCRRFTVDLERLPGGGVPTEVPRALEAAGAQLVTQGARAQLAHRRGEPRGVTDLGVQTRAVQYFDQGGSVTGDDWASRCHRLEHGYSEALDYRRLQQRAGCLHDRHQLGLG